MVSTNLTQTIPMSVRIRRFGMKLFIFFMLLCVSFYFFAPYQILKNYVLSQVRRTLIENRNFLNVNIGSLRPYWLSGIALKQVTLENTYENQRHPFTIDTVHARMSLLPLLIGHLTVKTDLLVPKGSGNFVASFPLFSALKGDFQNFEVTSTFQNFDIEGAMDQVLGIFQESTDPAMALLSPLIANTSVGGFLNGDVLWKTHDSVKIGSVNLSFDKLYLAMTDPSLAIPIQHFKQANVSVGFDGTTYTIKDSTVFESENLYLKPSGTISANSLNIDLLLIVSGQIEKNFGFLIPQILRCPSAAMVDGVINVRLTGTPSNYSCQ